MLSEPPLRKTVGKLKQRKRYHEKTRFGCLTCKARRVKCDEERPTCRRCRNANRSCAGYTDPVSRCSLDEDRDGKLQDHLSFLKARISQEADLEWKRAVRQATLLDAAGLKPIIQPSSALIDPFMVPVAEGTQSFVDRVIKFTFHAIWPQLASEKTHSEWLQRVMQSPMLLAINVWGHGRLYEWRLGLSFDQEKTKCITAFQAEAARLASEELQSLVVHPENKPSDELIVVVTMLAAYPELVSRDSGSSNSIATIQNLDFYGSQEANRHDDALETLLARKGGLEAIGIKEFANCVALRDLVLSSALSVTPRYSPWFNSSLLSHCNRGTQQVSAALMGVEEGLAFVISNMQKLVRILAGTESAGNLDTVDIAAARADIQYRLLSLQPSACRSAMLIFSDIAIFPLPSSTCPRSRLVHDFIQQKLELKGNPQFEVWAMSMPTMVADAESAKELIPNLQKILDQLGIHTYAAYKEVMRLYLWWDDTCNELGRALWERIHTPQS